MSLPWFRLYHRIIDDEKLRLLAFEDRWHFVAILSLKASGLMDEERGPMWERKVAVKLGVQLRELDEIGRRLHEVGLVDGALNPVAWDELQQRSDNSASRVKRYRDARKKAGLPAQWQPSKDLRSAVYARDGNACVYCRSESDLTIDHRIPVLRGGSNGLGNLQTACRACNAKKRDLTHKEYLARLEENGEFHKVAEHVLACNGYSNGIEEEREEDKKKKEPKGSTRTSVRKPDDVSHDVWRDFKKHRSKHGGVTDRVIAGFRREADKAGYTLEQAMDESITQGWRGFKAEFVKDKSNGKSTSVATAADRARSLLSGNGTGGMPRLSAPGRDE